MTRKQWSDYRVHYEREKALDEASPPGRGIPLMVGNCPPPREYVLAGFYREIAPDYPPTMAEALRARADEHERSVA